MNVNIATKIKLLFTIIVSLIGLNIIIVNYFKQKEKKDSVIVDIAGRNRMLSQKIALLAEMFAKGEPVGGELAKTIQMHHLSLAALRDGGKAPAMNADTPMPPVHKDAVATIQQVEIQWEAYKSNAEQVFFQHNDAVQQANALVYLEKNRNNMLKINNELVKAFVKINEAKQSQLNIVLGITFIINMAGLLMGFLFINKTVLLPIKVLAQQALTISEGDLREKVRFARQDEIGSLSRAIHQINNSFRNLAINMHHTANAISDASEQLQFSSTDLSNRTSMQASTTEEIASSMEEVLAVAHSNTESAEMAEASTNRSVEQVENSNQSLVQTIRSVENIRQKVATITDIATQTNILSINAYVEAAQAGSAGQGFAVVAQEVRALATKVKTASDEIEKLSQNGEQVSTQAGEKLNGIIPVIMTSAKLAHEIASASKEQQIGITTINDALLALGDTSIQNAHVAESLQTSSEKLSAHADQMKTLTAVFKH